MVKLPENKQKKPSETKKVIKITKKTIQTNQFQNDSIKKDIGFDTEESTSKGRERIKSWGSNDSFEPILYNELDKTLKRISLVEQYLDPDELEFINNIIHSSLFNEIDKLIENKKRTL